MISKTDRLIIFTLTALYVIATFYVILQMVYEGKNWQAFLVLSMWHGWLVAAYKLGKEYFRE